MPIDPGTNIGPYKVLDSLGAGGMGEVYLARDTRLGRKIALKFLSAEYTKDEDRVRRFQQEARAASALNHPNLITIFDIGEVDSVHFISTEFIEGDTLRKLVTTRRLSNTEIFEIAIQVGNALATAHAAGITHRDIKPENIMVRPDGVVKVLDFGLAKLTEPASGATAIDPTAITQRVVETNPGVVMGTVSYMSPEQARGATVDARTDIFSFGVVLYEMTAGRVPFEGSSFGDVISSILAKKQVPLARYSPDVPAELERIVGKALAKNREERYQSIKELLIDLKKLKQRLEVEAEIEHSAPPEWARDAVMGRRSSSGEARSGSSDTIELGASNQPVRTTSSAEYLVSEIKRHKKTTFFVLGAAVIAAVAITFVSTRRPIDSVAILPFSNKTGDSKMDAVTAEITEGIINQLYDLPNLRVISYGAVQQYRDREDFNTIAKDLGVSALLTGRINNRDGSISVNAELTDARDQTRIWSQQETLRFSDLMMAHHRLARSVLDKLGVKISDERRKELDAEDMYAKGRNYLSQRSTEGFNKAIEYLDKAVALKPNYALAHAGLADCYNMLASYGQRPPAEAFAMAKAEARKALDIDDNMAEAHTSLAFALFRGDWQWTAAEREFKTAQSLNPKSAQAHQWYSVMLAALGRQDKAITETNRAQELDSTSLVIRSNFGLVYFFAHRFDDSIAACQKVLELEPSFFVAQRYLGQAYAQKGKYEQAIEKFQSAASSGSLMLRAELANTYGLAGKKDEAQKILTDLQRQSSERYVSSYSIALIHSGLRDKEETFNALERALNERADYLVFLKVDPRFDWLHSDPRFARLVERIGLP
ncbi:MAG: protein kinase [Acidobacteriota bacterium]